MTRSRIALLCLLMFSTTACAGNADEVSDFGTHHFPVPKESTGKTPMPYEKDAMNMNALSEVRVKIFPHNNEKYNSPQGADKVWERVSFKTSGTCTSYKAGGDTSKNPGHQAQGLFTGNILRLSAATLPYSLWIRCTVPPQLIRTGFESKIIRYPGKFFVKKVSPRNRAPYITIVNVVNEAEYLKGVIPAEMPASWPAEALKVQAIAARTYFRYEIATDVASKDPNLLVENSGAQLDDTVLYQAYLGMYGQASSDTAVEVTENQVMTYDGEIIKAYFSADSGGHTENAENVWGVYLPYAIGKPEPYPDGSVSVSRWTSTRTFRDVQQRLLALGLITKTIAATGVKITDFYAHGRVKEVTLTFSDGKTQKVGGLDFAHAMGLRSNWFSFSSVKGGVQLNGRGFGHGVGMNQWGTRFLVGSFGWSYTQVLGFYYTGIKIETLN